jgi:hypothetical protein
MLDQDMTLLNSIIVLQEKAWSRSLGCLECLRSGIQPHATASRHERYAG